MTKKVLYTKVITCCDRCPHSKTKLTKGYGYAEDYLCSKAHNKMIACYVENGNPGPIPEWCPLEVVEQKPLNDNWDYGI